MEYTVIVETSEVIHVDAANDAEAYERAQAEFLKMPKGKCRGLIFSHNATEGE